MAFVPRLVAMGTPPGELPNQPPSTQVVGQQTAPSTVVPMGGSLGRIAISRAEPIGPYLGWRPLMPVTQWAALKP